MEGFLWKKGRGDSVLSRHNWKKRWFILDKDILTYYETFNNDTDEPINQKGAALIEGCVTKILEHKEKEFAFQITHDARSPLHLCAEDQKTMDIWMTSLSKASNLATIPPPMTYHEALEIIGIKSDNNELTLSMVNKSYRKKCLKVHPDKGGDPLEFKKVQEAFDMLIVKIEEDEIDRSTKLIEYQCTIQKGPKGIGYGLLIAEDTRKQVVSIKDVLPQVQIKKISDAARGTIQKGDVIVRIGRDNIYKWPVGRVVQRLNDFRVPIGNDVELTFTRKVRLDDASGSGINSLPNTSTDEDEALYIQREKARQQETAIIVEKIKNRNMSYVGNNVPFGTDIDEENTATNSSAYATSTNTTAGSYVQRVMQPTGSNSSSTRSNDNEGNMQRELVQTKMKLDKATRDMHQLQAKYDDLHFKYTAAQEQIVNLAQSVALSNSNVHESKKREEYALSQLQAMMNMSEITSDQLVQCTRDVMNVSINVKAGASMLVPKEVDDYLATSPNTSMKSGVDSTIQSAQRKAMSAAINVDGSGTLLKRWDLSGDNALDRLQRLENKLDKLNNMGKSLNTSSRQATSAMATSSSSSTPSSSAYATPIVKSSLHSNSTPPSSNTYSVTKTTSPSFKAVAATSRLAGIIRKK